MKEILIAFLVPHILALPVYLVLLSKRRDKTQETAPETTIEDEAGVDIRDILFRAYKGLKAAHVGCDWRIVACIDEIDKGGDVDAGIAAFAIKETEKDTGSLPCLTLALSELGMGE